ncbi:hypothetical protein J437_LFUL007755 [Ladona fulva]|uniref:PiggyBac transposable element-derived protein domain-containing protein n=1 Tax=Ladona fulva TaxID=123851 RepID=A0A8K0KH60_LADFU|nr:hypothetical protein J437_LFUL007755 [Ladona fulva]
MPFPGFPAAPSVAASTGRWFLWDLSSQEERRVVPACIGLGSKEAGLDVGAMEGASWRVHQMSEEKFRELYTPERDITIDESLLLYKGRLGWRQYMPQKRATFEIKTFMLCELKSGYVWSTVEDEENWKCNEYSKLSEAKRLEEKDKKILELEAQLAEAREMIKRL